MKKLLKHFISIISKMIFILFNYNSFLRIKKYFNLIRTNWLKNSFKSIGEAPNFKFPVFLKGTEYITIGDRFSSLDSLRIECWDFFNENKYSPNLIIGNNVAFNRNCHIGCINSVFIGDNVLIGSNVLITDHQHGSNDLKTLKIPPIESLISKGDVVIENNVWIGENAVIMPGVRIGKNSIVGANSVVTKSFKNNSIIGGVPAKLIKFSNE